MRTQTNATRATRSTSGIMVNDRRNVRMSQVENLYRFTRRESVAETGWAVFQSLKASVRPTYVFQIARFTLQEAVSRRLVLAGVVISLGFIALFCLGFHFAFDKGIENTSS